MQNPRLLIVEDDAFTRASIVGALLASGMDVIDSVGTSADAVTSFKKHEPDAVLLDLDLGYGPTGLDLARAFRIRNPHLGLVILTTYTDPRLLRSNLPDVPSGAEYLVKSNVGEIKTVSEAITRAIDSARNSNLTQKQSKSVSPRDIQGMSDIQVETLRMVAQGYTNSEIAKQRFVSEKAVEQTIAKIAKALNIPAATNQNQRVHIARIYFRLTGQAKP